MRSTLLAVPADRRETTRVDVVVIHETNGRKYFEALIALEKQGLIGSLDFFEASSLWKFVHSIVRERRAVGTALRQSWRNLLFKLRTPALRNKVIILCVAPWDFRLPFFGRLRANNRLIYNTSWSTWSREKVPRPAGMATSLLMRAWRTVLGDESVTLSAVTSAAAAGLRSFVGDRPVAVVPHVVSEEFFSRSAVYRAPFRLLFVGELVEHRGLRVLGELSALLPPGSFTLDIVGDGPLRELAATLASKSGGTWHRQVADRKRLAAIIASSQLLVSPSIRTKRWEELFGMALLEAMASGVPCIASDHVGPRSLIENGISGVLVPENSPSAIASAVLRFAEDERLWQSMSRAAKARAEAFRLPYVTSRWAEILGVAEPADTQ